LLLDSSRARACLGWNCLLSQREAVTWTADWHKGVRAHPDAARALAEQQIGAFSQRLAGSVSVDQTSAPRAAEVG
jgi:hypothetical protein